MEEKQFERASKFEYIAWTAGRLTKGLGRRKTVSTRLNRLVDYKSTFDSLNVLTSELVKFMLKDGHHQVVKVFSVLVKELFSVIHSFVGELSDEKQSCDYSSQTLREELIPDEPVIREPGFRAVKKEFNQEALPELSTHDFEERRKTLLKLMPSSASSLLDDISSNLHENSNFLKLLRNKSVRIMLENEGVLMETPEQFQNMKEMVNYIIGKVDESIRKGSGQYMLSLLNSACSRINESCHRIVSRATQTKREAAGAEDPQDDPFDKYEKLIDSYANEISGLKRDLGLEKQLSAGLHDVLCKYKIENLKREEDISRVKLQFEKEEYRLREESTVRLNEYKKLEKARQAEVEEEHRQALQRLSKQVEYQEKRVADKARELSGLKEKYLVVLSMLDRARLQAETQTCLQTEDKHVQVKVVERRGNYKRTIDIKAEDYGQDTKDSSIPMLHRARSRILEEGAETDPSQNPSEIKSKILSDKSMERNQRYGEEDPNTVEVVEQSEEQDDLQLASVEEQGENQADSQVQSKRKTTRLATKVEPAREERTKRTKGNNKSLAQIECSSLYIDRPFRILHQKSWGKYSQSKLLANKTRSDSDPCLQVRQFSLFFDEAEAKKYQSLVWNSDCFTEKPLFFVYGTETAHTQRLLNSRQTNEQKVEQFLYSLSTRNLFMYTVLSNFLVAPLREEVQQPVYFSSRGVALLLIRLRKIHSRNCTNCRHVENYWQSQGLTLH